MTPPPDKVVARCLQLLRLAKSTNYPHEADLARQKAKRLIDRYEITNQHLASYRARHEQGTRARPRPRRQQSPRPRQTSYGHYRPEIQHAIVKLTTRKRDQASHCRIIDDAAHIYQVRVSIKSCETKKRRFFGPTMVEITFNVAGATTDLYFFKKWMAIYAQPVS